MKLPKIVKINGLWVAVAEIGKREHKRPAYVKTFSPIYGTPEENLNQKKLYEDIIRRNEENYPYMTETQQLRWNGFGHGLIKRELMTVESYIEAQNTKGVRGWWKRLTVM